MLERATSCVEPGVSAFLRRIERPPRSRRVLHPSFWRPGGENNPIPTWWPAYLQDIRDIPNPPCRAHYFPLNVLELGNNDKNVHQKANPVGRGLSRTRDNSILAGRRTFSVSYRKPEGQLPHTQDEESFKHEHVKYVPMANDLGLGSDLVKSLFVHRDVSYSGGPVNIPLPGASPQPSRHPQPEEALRALMASNQREAYNKAWLLFLEVSDQVEFAGNVLQYLSTSQDKGTLDRALRAYKLLAADDKTLPHYQAAIKAASHGKQYELAIEIHQEAVLKGFCGQTTNSLLDFLVRKELWTTAALVWSNLPLAQRSAANFRNSDIWKEIGQYTALPRSLLTLVERLGTNAEAFASERDLVCGLSVQLFYRALSSVEVMANITGSGTLALLDRFHELGLLMPQHYFSGIQALNKMAGTRNRHQLAILLYRNLDMRFPHTRLPRSVLGCLLVILCGSEGGHLASRVILRRFARDWGIPDQMAYQKVLSACARHGDVSALKKTFTEFCIDHGRPSDLGYLTPLLYVHARLGDVPQTRAQFDRIPSEFGMEPNTYCWNILLTAHVRAGDRKGAFETFQNMRSIGVTPDQHTYGTLMALCARFGDTVAVHQLVDKAREQQVKGTSAMIDSLVHSYCLNDQIEDAENLVEAATQMQLKGSPTRMWNTLLRHYAFRADTDAVLRTQERMGQLSVPADEMTYAAFMQSLVHIGRTKDAASILRSLHLSNSITATVFHYSIVLYGYALEDNRDMVTVVYNEMVERFPSVGLSARLSVLRSQVQRDAVLSQARLNQALQGKPMNKGLRLSRTLEFLAQTLLEVKQSDLITDLPQPGLSRRSPSDAFSSVYLEFLLSALGRSGALQKAENLLGRYLSLMDTTNRQKTMDSPSIQLLTALMITLVQQKRYALVDRYWNKALSLAIEKGRPYAVDLTDPVTHGLGGRSSTPRPDAGSISLRTATSASGFMPNHLFLDGDDVRILPAHQYSLAAPLTQYMYALAAQDLASNLPPLVRRLEDMGFSLSSKNWNHYVQILSYSNEPQLQVLAFRIFESKLLPEMPPWQLMKRGKWAKQTIVDGSSDIILEDPVERKFVEKFRPHTFVPTYWTMVYLGLALMKAQQRTAKGESPGLPELRSKAPGTAAAVTRMPYLREKAQGLLLRGRSLQGDLQKRPRRPQRPERSGLRGSRSPLDHIPLGVTDQDWVKALEHEQNEPDELVRSEPARSEQQIRVQVAERILGEVQRGPLVFEAAGRFEHGLERLKRLRNEEREKLGQLETMRADAAHSQLMANEYRGEPFFDAHLDEGRPKREMVSVGEAHGPEKKLSLSRVVDRLLKSRQRVSWSISSKGPSDIPPAAALSAARRPKAAERLQNVRRRRPNRLAIPLSGAAFKRGVGGKVIAALMTYQPRRRTPKRLRVAFSRNRASRRLRIQKRIWSRVKSNSTGYAQQAKSLATLESLDSGSEDLARQ